METTGRSLGKMITAARLVVDYRDEAGRVGAKGILGGRIGDSTSRKRRDVGCSTIRSTFNLIERAIVGSIKGTSGAVRGNAGCSAGGVDVARPSCGDKGTRGNKAKSEQAGAFGFYSWKHDGHVCKDYSVGDDRR
ncbi:hypothetical protein EYB25_001080 [Talaromyces marneffei]|nr:hypothetical protein EYB25_001080 [Talaromyces marneffei]